MYEVLTPILKGIDYNPVDLMHNLWVIIAPADKYLARYNASLVIPSRRALFDTTIAEDIPNAVLHQADGRTYSLPQCPRPLRRRQ